MCPLPLEPLSHSCLALKFSKITFKEKQEKIWSREETGVRNKSHVECTKPVKLLIFKQGLNNWFTWFLKQSWNCFYRESWRGSWWDCVVSESRGKEESVLSFLKGKSEWEGRRLFKLMNASFLSLSLQEQPKTKDLFHYPLVSTPSAFQEGQHFPAMIMVVWIWFFKSLYQHSKNTSDTQRHCILFLLLVAPRSFSPFS